MQHMHGNIPYMFYYWPDPVVYLLQVQSSMDCMRWMYVWKAMWLSLVVGERECKILNHTVLELRI